MAEPEAAAAAAPAAAEVEEEREEELAKLKDPRYPIEVKYCTVCGMPPEYCENGPCLAKCKQAHPENFPEAEEGQEQQEDAAAAGGKKRAGKAQIKVPDSGHVKVLPGGKLKKKDAPSVVISKTARQKRKFVTTVAGLDGFGVKLSDAAKQMAKSFSCGASVVKTASGTEEIDIQGDVVDEMVAVITSKFSVPVECIFVMEGKEKKPASL
eukprot:m51a1_g2438 hypothetical protein (210) ;mRNA; r:853770-854674